MHGLSDVSWSQASRTVFERMRTGGFEFHNLDSLFGAAVRTEAPVIANQPAADARSGGVPPGHPALKAFLGLPLFHGGQLIGMVGLANAAGGYDEALVAELEPMTATCASMIIALRIEQERKRVEDSLNRRIAFERLVARISSELVRTPLAVARTASIMPSSLATEVLKASLSRSCSPGGMAVMRWVRSPSASRDKAPDSVSTRPAA